MATLDLAFLRDKKEMLLGKLEVNWSVSTPLCIGHSAQASRRKYIFTKVHQKVLQPFIYIAQMHYI